MYPPQGVKLTAEEVASRGRKPMLKLLNLYGPMKTGGLWNQMLDENLRELKYNNQARICVYITRLRRLRYF
jgi:hypothetical protein